jgi:hypothetical protein
MNSFHLKTALLLFSVLITGCTPAPKPAPLTQGVKLKDLAPVDAGERGTMRPSVNLKAIVLAVPANEYPRAIRMAMGTMTTGRGMLNSPADFYANGFAAGTGNVRDLDRLTAILNQAGARVLTSSYFTTILDDKGNDIDMVTVSVPMSISYLNEGAIKNAALNPGRLVLRIQVRQMAARGSVYRLSMRPVWTPMGSGAWLGKYEELSDREIVFGAAGVEMAVQDNDMIFMAPAEYKADRSNLANLLMGLPGNEPEVRMAVILFGGAGK